MNEHQNLMKLKCCIEKVITILMSSEEVITVLEEGQVSLPVGLFAGIICEIICQFEACLDVCVAIQ